MAVGDFLIRRNDAETNTLTVAPQDFGWDTQVAVKGSAITYSGGTFTLVDAGNYLVIHSERFDTTDTTNNARSEAQAMLRINAADTVPGKGQGFVRKSSGQQEAIVNGSAIINVGAGATLNTRYWDSGDTVQAPFPSRVPDWGGIQIIKLDDTQDYGRYHHNTTQTPATTITPVNVAFNTNDEQDTGFSNSAGAITITDAGVYFVSFTLPVNMASGSDRTEFNGYLTLDDVRVTGTTTGTYIRGTDNTHDGVLTWAGFIDVAALDVLKAATIKTDGTSTCTIGSGASIEVWKMPVGAETFINQSTTGNFNTATETEFVKGTLIQNDAAGWTTSTTTEMNLEVADDVLIFASFSSIASGTRAYPTARIRVNTTTQNYMAGGEYGRNSGGAQFCAFHVGGLIAGLSDNDDISITTLALSVTTAMTGVTNSFSGLRLSSVFAAPSAGLTIPSGASVSVGGAPILSAAVEIPSGVSVSTGGALALLTGLLIPSGVSVSTGGALALSAAVEIPSGVSVSTGGALTFAEKPDAIELINTSSNNNDSASSMVLNVPTGTIDDDLILFFGSCDGGVGYDLPSGFTLLEEFVLGFSTHVNILAYRIASSEPASYTIDVGFGGSEDGIGIFATYRGVDVSDPINTSNHNFSSGGTTRAIASITPDKDDCAVVLFIGIDTGNDGNPFVTSWPSTIVEQLDNVNGPPGTSSGGASAAFGDVIQTTATTVSGDITTTVSSTNNTMGVALNIAPPVEGVEIPSGVSVSVGGALALSAAVEIPSGVSVSTGGALTLSAAVEIPSGVSVSTGGALALSAAVEIPSGVSVSVGGALALSAAVEIPSGVSVSVGGALILLSGLEIPSGVSVSVGGAPILSAAVEIPSGVSVSVGGALALSASVEIPSGVSVSVGGASTLTVSLEIPSGVSVSTGGALALSAAVEIPSGASVSVGGALALSAAVEIPSGVSVSTGDALALSASVEIPSGVSVSTGDALALSASVEIPSGVSVSVGGASTLTVSLEIPSGVSVSTGGASTLTVSLEIPSGASVSAGGALILLSGLEIPSGVSVSTGGALALSVSLEIPSGVSVSAGENLVLTASVEIASGVSVSTGGVLFFGQPTFKELQVNTIYIEDPATGAIYIEDPATGAIYIEDPATGAIYIEDPATGAIYIENVKRKVIF